MSKHSDLDAAFGNALFAAQAAKGVARAAESLTDISHEPSSARRLTFKRDESPHAVRAAKATPDTEVEVLKERLASMAAQFEQLKAERAAAAPKLRLMVSAKGGLSLYGMGRWPVTLYRSQWEVLLGEKEKILAFIAANSARLSVKGD